MTQGVSVQDGLEGNGVSAESEAPADPQTGQLAQHPWPVGKGVPAATRNLDNEFAAAEKVAAQAGSRTPLHTTFPQIHFVAQLCGNAIARSL